MLVVSGTGRFFVGHQVYDLRPGTLIWQVSAQRHRLQRGPNLEMWVAQLHADILGPQRAQDLANRPCRMVPPHELADIDRLLAQVAQDSDEISVYNAGLSYAVERLWRAGRSQPSLTPRSIHPAVARAILLLRRSGASASLEEIARQTGVAPSYLSRLVVAHTGRGFVDWRNRIRLEHFMDAYRPGANLLDLALDSGFGSYSRFNHVFHEIVGCAPMVWVEHGGQVPPDLAGHTVPEGAATALSTRSAWGELLPLVSALLRPLLGTGCLARVLQPGSVARGSAALRMRSLESGLSAPQRSWLAKSLAEHEPAAAALLQQVLAQHDFASLHANVLGAYGLSSTNPCDALAMLCCQVVGNDVAVTMAGAAGQFELNVNKPVMIHALLQSVRLLADGMASFDAHCARGIEPDRARMAELVERSLMLVTALNPHIGYERAAQIARAAHRSGSTLREAAIASGFVSADEFDAWVRPQAMLGGGGR